MSTTIASAQATTTRIEAFSAIVFVLARVGKIRRRTLKKIISASRNAETRSARFCNRASASGSSGAAEVVGNLFFHRRHAARLGAGCGGHDAFSRRRRRAETLRRCVPARTTRMRSLTRRISGRSEEIIRIAHAARRQIGDDAMNLRLGADVDAMRRLVEDQHRGIGREPFAEHDLLPISA